MTHGLAGPLARRALLAFAASCLLPGAESFGEAPKFLIVSSPRRSRIAYTPLPASGAPLDGATEMRVLVDQGLRFPQGIAVDQYRKRLFVADPNLGFLAGYDIAHDRDGIRVGKMWTAARDVEVRSVAVDGLGNVFFADEPKQLIMKLTAQQIESGDTSAQVVYDSVTTPQVSAPGGIALDNYFVYWLNKANGNQLGTVVRAPQDPSLANSSSPQSGLGVVSLSANAAKCYGLCLGLKHIYYTDENINVYGVPRAATARHNPVTVSSVLQEPRGCAFDGDGTVYVADKDRHAVYHFASNMPTLLPERPLTRAADLEGAYGVVVYVKIVD